MSNGSSPGLGLHLAGVPTVRLEGPILDTYLASVEALLRQARLSTYYPDSRRLRNHLHAMTSGVQRGLYPTLLVDLRSGLPAYQEWVRVQTDRRLAAKFLVDLGERRVLEKKSDRSALDKRQLLKWDYYSALEGLEIAGLGDMEVHLRKVDPAEHRAWFHVVLDKLDVSGLFVRYSIDLSEKSGFWNRAMLTLDQDAASHTQEFLSLVYKFTSLDAEFSYFKLVTLGGLDVERVIKGTVGPIYFGGRKYPGPMGEIVAQDRTGLVATFGLDMVASDLESSKDNDPLLDLMEADLSQEARQEYRRARGRLGYKVFKDRKFVATPNFRGHIEELCRREGTRNIIRVVRIDSLAELQSVGGDRR